MVQVAVIMGSISDWPVMQATTAQLKELGVTFEKHIISAHRMPNELQEFGLTAQTKGLKVIIAGAGGAAHLPGMVAANTQIPVIGVPMQTHALNGLDSLLSIVQMPTGVPVATVAIGKAGASNAAILAAEIVALNDSAVARNLASFRANQTYMAQESEAQLDEDE
ncbi:5-(carboxyamino)imidazole ribonucleotide mutase [Periweissella beninensis]|uniref:N5-carboxyaminoimidazole ribonucleotide mutase n=1 Tax=Periweissella beninensis TaxID=504936 RepID=A0ABT0VJZ1_9LACO|nr:5-(carboxyamino)imidazole ribonucleotide mutase [Periweissella beninensis]MBM7543869.1 5-(carboxyamino)imidazole ribonucleotide mutase [Periweissella beninensis]MCM2436750.1 5-(carboxyamino)imidazole ribonucleotide mutase [Periweissella beninensis]MCT4395540.1 5-(carboxyamino)imidazole ribonucleotide mutase [Periweissella beninensis]